MSTADDTASAADDRAREIDLDEIAARHPDLALSSGMDEPALKELELKYRLRLQIAEQALKERELKLKERSSSIERLANPLTVGVLVGALSLLGSFINGLWSNFNQRDQLTNQKETERTKLQNDLIKEAIKPADEKERAKSLVFFAKNRLIELDAEVLNSLVAVAGSEQPVPGSSSADTGPSWKDLPISYSQSVVDKIRNSPGVPYPEGKTPSPAPDQHIKAIVLHYAVGPDSSVGIMRAGRPGLPGPLAHWAVLSDGTIEFIADENQKVNHVGRAERDLTNTNTIAIETTGATAFADVRQVENLVRLVADAADRWGVPTEMIVSHAEISGGRKIDMLQQAPEIRKMVEAVRKKE